MNLDVGEVLARAWQITWKFKVLWVFNMFPVLIGFLFLLVLIIPMFFLGPNALIHQDLNGGPSYNSLLITTDILLAVLLVIFYALGAASASLGIFRIETGRERLSFQDLFQDGLDYFGRVLGVTLVGGSLVLVTLLILSVWMRLLGRVPLGLGMMCLQPALLLVYPGVLLVYALIEESQAASIADKLQVTQAIARSWKLLRDHFWQFVFMSILVYFGVFILSGIAALPLLAPFFFTQVIVQNPSMDSQVSSIGWTVMTLSLVLLPVFALVQGLCLTFMKSAYMLIYLRLSRPVVLQPAAQVITP